MNHVIQIHMYWGVCVSAYLYTVHDQELIFIKSIVKVEHDNAYILFIFPLVNHKLSPSNSTAQHEKLNLQSEPTQQRGFNSLKKKSSSNSELSENPPIFTLLCDCYVFRQVWTVMDESTDQFLALRRKNFELEKLSFHF